ncbi:acyl-CoA thioesterase [Povalibacter uvarum]|uniref:Acyl-CoA thioesterase n=1 Tax=Povalibacter uvarum TaxID=732238 RepID=A0A841HLY8_9GAMM|nr:thioesterase family protein [Povalibacter uvarum]MBB6093218.1 acyl-CoA thioesterase [Povalibacter uvarum]
MTLSEILQTIRGDGSTFQVTVTDDWGQGRAMFGGLIAAVGNEVLRKLVPQDRLLRSLQTTFVGPATAGTWQINARVLRVGKAVTIAHCDVLDGGQVAATVVGVYGGPRASAVKLKPEPTPAPRGVDEAREVQFKDGAPQFLQHFAVRWVQGAKPFSGSPRTPTKAFIRHRDPTPLTESHVVALIDCIPTPAMSMFLAPAPSSSLVWTLEFFDHRFDFPPDAWWRIDTDLDAAGDGYVNQTGVLNAPDGKPVALTRQLFAVFG